MFVLAGEKPYTFEICDKAFSRRQSVKRHLITHYRQADKSDLMEGFVKQHELNCELSSKTNKIQLSA